MTVRVPDVASEDGSSRRPAAHEGGRGPGFTQSGGKGSLAPSLRGHPHD